MRRTVLITGAGQGIGLGVAKAFAAAGDAILLAGRTVSKVEQAAAAIASNGGAAAAVACDVKRPDDLEAAVAAAKERFGSIDIVVNTAQEVPLGLLTAVSDEDFVAAFESGPLASFRLMKLVRPHMAEQGGGIVFNFASSAAVRWDMSGFGAYAAVKQATRALTRAAAAEWGADNIRVLTIAPLAGSPGLEWWTENNPDEARSFLGTIPLGRVGRLEEDIGRAVVALARSDLGYLTGATIPLDGGQANFD